MTDAEVLEGLEGAKVRVLILTEWLQRFPGDESLRAELSDALGRVAYLSHWFRRN